MVGWTAAVLMCPPQSCLSLSKLTWRARAAVRPTLSPPSMVITGAKWHLAIEQPTNFDDTAERRADGSLTFQAQRRDGLHCPALLNPCLYFLVSLLLRAASFILSAITFSPFPIHRSYALVCSYVDADVKLIVVPLGMPSGNKSTLQG